jgi:hypothetical protein
MKWRTAPSSKAVATPNRRMGGESFLKISLRPQPFCELRVRLCGRCGWPGGKRMSLLLLIILLVIIFGGGGGYYGYNRWGGPGLGGVLGLVLIVVVVVWLVNHTAPVG